MPDETIGEDQDHLASRFLRMIISDARGAAAPEDEKGFR
ncbi:hypothetical protein HDF16_006169 [Granulicella aggregans]|uniref:Uncharacterized protein n=1 Tax=Granulicella aggregans TaxID=474949 RepID=A0A7W7ZKC1_9BACT|nr:hypothetical protein [Granulicella aggregans]